MALREAPFAFMDLLHATCGRGTSFQIGPDGARYACFACGATFEQTKDGFRALRDHEAEHGRGVVVDLADLDGKTLRIVTWVAKSRDHSHGHGTPEIWGVDDAHGVVYHLSNAYQQDTVWKWRIKSKRSGALAALSAATPRAQDLLCDTFAASDESCGPVDAGTSPAKG